MHMGGVDRADMLCGSYGLSWKSKKWWHRVFFGLIDRTLVNAYIVYRQICENKTRLNFRREVPLALLTMSRPPRVGRPFKSPCPSPSLGKPAANGGIKKRRKGNFSVSDAVRL
ncbi:PiggyBac transposable element-derived protein 4-like [Plakobranchus ocellatus]|uniref:PiggyBac transposable element-derived protein 4-like n=1 Tax=Plakobranchus ocellatus TaxID=259542 RepID=A0AAV4BNZ7_9GAST|nr:PiggyBac transposable element-derived protein 4-like [Plakobranchus ocellatus]